MNTVFKAADRYIAESDWKTIAVLKFCLISLGMLIGMLIKPRHKKAVAAGALCVFAITYVPLMAKFADALLKTYRESREQEEE